MDHAEVLSTMETLIAAGETVSTHTENTATDWEHIMLEGSDLETVITREAELRGADLIFMRSRRRPFAAEEILSYAEANEVDLISMGAAWNRLWHSYALRIKCR
jgi:nucleotide-binding universal stress UspA family protein